MNENKRPETMQRITTPALAEAFIAEQLEALRKQIGGNKVLLALSGGVDSSVVAALLIKAVGSQLTCVHVNHGLLRKGEPEKISCPILLFSAEKDKTEGFEMPEIVHQPRKRAERKKETKPEKEGIEHEEV